MPAQHTSRLPSSRPFTKTESCHSTKSASWKKLREYPYLCFCRSNYTVTKMTDQQFLRLVTVRFQNPVMSPHEIAEHCVLLLPLQDDRLDRHSSARNHRG